MSLYIIPSNLGYGTRAALSSSIKHHGRREQVLPFLDPSWFLNPLNDPVFNHTAPWAVGCTPREARETGEDRASPKKGPTISNCRYSEAFTLRFGAVSCENKKLTSDGRALFGQIDQSRRSLERPFCLPACHNYRISSIFMIERLMPGNYKRTRYFSCTRCILRDFYLFIFFICRIYIWK